MTESKTETKRGTWVSYKEAGTGGIPMVSTVRLHSSERDALRAAVKIGARVVLVTPGELLVDAIKAESGEEADPVAEIREASGGSRVIHEPITDGSPEPAKVAKDEYVAPPVVNEPEAGPLPLPVPRGRKSKAEIA